jgi:hypothetical protein
MENDNTPTLVHQGRYTVNDYSFTRGCTIVNWTVLTEEESMSDHRYILFDLVLENADKNKKWYRHQIDEEKLNTIIEDCPFLDWEASSAEEVQRKAETVTNWMEYCMDECTTMKEVKSHVYWWTDELQLLKEEIKRTKRKKQRTNNECTKRELAEEIKLLRYTLKNEISKAKVRKWREFTSINHPWGRPYKLIVKPREGCGVHPHILKEDGSVTANVEEDY